MHLQPPYIQKGSNTIKPLQNAKSWVDDRKIALSTDHNNHQHWNSNSKNNVKGAILHARYHMACSLDDRKEGFGDRAVYESENVIYQYLNNCQHYHISFC